MIDPVKFAIVVESNDTVHVEYLVLCLVLQVEVGSHHRVGRQSHQHSVERTPRKEPVGSVRVGSVKDSIGVDFLLGPDGCDVDFVHILYRENIVMMLGEDFSESSHDGCVIFQIQALLVRSFLSMRPDMGGFGNGRNVLIDPVPHVFYRLGTSHLDHKTVVSNNDFGKEAMAHENRVNDEGHEPHGMNDQHVGFCVNVGAHVGRFLAQIVC